MRIWSWEQCGETSLVLLGFLTLALSVGNLSTRGQVRSPPLSYFVYVYDGPSPASHLHTHTSITDLISVHQSRLSFFLSVFLNLPVVHSRTLAPSFCPSHLPTGPSYMSSLIKTHSCFLSLLLQGKHSRYHLSPLHSDCQSG